MAKEFGIDDYFIGQSIGAISISSNGNGVVYSLSESDLESNRQGSNLHLCEVDTGEAFQLTNGPRRNDSPQWSPDGEWIAFLSNRPDGQSRGVAGSPRTQIWLIRPNGGEAERLTDSKSSVSNFKWSPKGDRIAYQATDPLSKEGEKEKKEKRDARVVDRNVKMSHLWSTDLVDRESKRLTRGRFHITGFDWSPTGNHLVYAYGRTSVSDDMRPVNLAVIPSVGGKRRLLVQRSGTDSNPLWSPDGKTISFLSQGGSAELQAGYRMWTIPARGGESQCLMPTEDRIGGVVGWSPDSRYLFYLANRGVRTHLRRVSLATGRSVGVLEKDDVISSARLSRDGRNLAFVRQNGRTAPEVHVSDIQAREVECLSDVNEHLGDYRFGRKEIVTWKSSDGLEIEGLLIKPLGYKRGRRYPLLVVVHGGPAGVFLNTHDGGFRGAYPVAVFAQQGYAVLLPNPRGSSGYGDVFRRANYKDWGGGDYEDIMTGVDAMIDRGIANANRLGIMGWSYGGYMTSWLVTQTTRFRAVSIGAGITNLYSMYGSNDVSGFLKSFFGDYPWRDPEEYACHSAISFVDKVKTPVMIQHGEQDVRVPYSQALEFYQALKDRKVPVEFVSYPRQGHGISEPRLLKDAMQRNLDWFNRWVKGRGGK